MSEQLLALKRAVEFGLAHGKTNMIVELATLHDLFCGLDCLRVTLTTVADISQVHADGLRRAAQLLAPTPPGGSAADGH